MLEVVGTRYIFYCLRLNKSGVGLFHFDRKKYSPALILIAKFDRDAYKFYVPF